MQSRVSGNFIISFITVILGAVPLPGEADDSSSRDNPRITPTVQAVRKVLPSVVNISTRRLVRVSDPFEAFFHDFFKEPPRYYRQSIPLGSGILVDPDGLIITNHHVIQRASNIIVMLSNGQSCRAQLIAFDTQQDLALLQLHGEFDTSGAEGFEFGLPGDHLLGEPVVAVGNPFGLGSSVTTGVLSAVNRSLSEGNIEFHDILQTDAAINPGNSGGPLINLNGQLLGMNLAIRRGAEGIGFAIPAGRIERVLSRWLMPSQFSDGHLGFRLETTVDNGVSQATLREILPASPAAAEGIDAGDVVIAINGRKVTRALEAGRILWQLKSGDKVTLDLKDKGRRILRVRQMDADQLIARRLDIRVQKLTAALKEAMGLPERLDGLAISEVLDEGLEEKGLRRGNVIYRIGTVATPDSQALAQQLRKSVPGQPVELHLIGFTRYNGRSYLDQYVIRVIVQ